MGIKWCVVEIVQEFDEAFDGSLCRVTKVLQVFDKESDAIEAAEIFDPMNYGDYDTSIRVCSSDKLNERFR